MMNKVYSIIILALMLTAMNSCNKGPQPLEKILNGEIVQILNPHKTVPLGALLKLNTNEETRVEFTVTGPIPVTRQFPLYSKYHEVPVTGLYADSINTIHIRLTTLSNKIFEGDIQIKTDPLPNVFPEIEIVKLDRQQMEPGMHLVELLIANNGVFLPYTVMFDDNGDIRWFLDLSQLGHITYTALRIQNGNWLYLSWVDLYEIDDLGKLMKHQQMSVYSGDHEIIEMPDGNLIMGASKKDTKIYSEGKLVPTIFDFAIEWDRKSNQLLREWDLREVLDVDRSVYPKDFIRDLGTDWFHINSVAISPIDQDLLISGRNQCVLKVDSLNRLKWILSAHKSWGKTGYDGSGPDSKDYLLTAVDSLGNAFPEPIQLGLESTDEFEWPTGQHAAEQLENGHIIMFDNGLARNFSPKPLYSRAVEYKIDEKNKTIQQVWEFGKSKGLEMFSGITSDVDVLPKTNNRLITSGNIRLSTKPAHAKLIEVQYPTNHVVFEANIYFKDALGTKAKEWAQFDLVFKGERYPLFHKE